MARSIAHFPAVELPNSHPKTPHFRRGFHASIGLELGWGRLPKARTPFPSFPEDSMRPYPVILVLSLLGACGEPEPPRTSAQGPVSRESPPSGGAPSQSSQRPALDIHTIVNQPPARADQRLGKPASVKKDATAGGEWRSYKTRGLGEVSIRFAAAKPAELIVKLESPAENAGAALRRIALNESRAADEPGEVEEVWRGNVGSIEWESVKVAKDERGWSRVHALARVASAGSPP